MVVSGSLVQPSSVARLEATPGPLALGRAQSLWPLGTQQPWSAALFSLWAQGTGDGATVLWAGRPWVASHPQLGVVGTGPVSPWGCPVGVDTCPAPLAPEHLALHPQAPRLVLVTPGTPTTSCLLLLCFLTLCLCCSLQNRN